MEEVAGRIDGMSWRKKEKTNNLKKKTAPRACRAFLLTQSGVRYQLPLSRTACRPQWICRVSNIQTASSVTIGRDTEGMPGPQVDDKGP